MPKEKDLEGQQDQGGKHGGQAGMARPASGGPSDQGTVRGEEQPHDKARAQQVSRQVKRTTPGPIGAVPVWTCAAVTFELGPDARRFFAPALVTPPERVAGIVCIVFRQQDVQHRAERLGSFLWKRQKMPRSDFCEVSLFVIPNHPVVHWVNERFKPFW
jgi:hypothetical protein